MSEAAIVVDLKGLGKKVAHRPKSFIVFELLQNAWDENVSRVEVTAHMIPGRAVCQISVEDDSPEGFQDLASVYTMFRDSKKAPDPTKRGRFEMGEKLVLALAIRAEVSSTKGTIVFEAGKRQNLRAKRTSGTVFEGEFKMTREEYEDMVRDVKLLAVPSHIKTFFNGKELIPRLPAADFQTSLQTVKSDSEGFLTTTQRRTDVKVYTVRDGETAHIYEMGIPVVETGDKWHYDVQQRVPVNWERNNVPPSFLRALRVEVLNALPSRLGDDARAPWVTDALDDARVGPEAVKSVLRGRFGDMAVINDPSDTEGTKIAMSQGYTVIPGGAFSKAAWENIRSSEAVLPAGQVTPSPKPYDPNGRPEKTLPRNTWTPDMTRIADFSMKLFRELMDGDFLAEVVIVNEPQATWAANFGDTFGARLCLNYGRLGKSWFARQNRDVEVLNLLLHEFVHHTVEDHLSDDMHKTATRLGAKLVQIALDNPGVFA
jgi:hypothetical protein